MTEKPEPMTVGKLRQRLELFPDDWTVEFSGLDFYRLEPRGDKLVQMEFNQLIQNIDEYHAEAVNLEI